MRTLYGRLLAVVSLKTATQPRDKTIDIRFSQADSARASR